jgi:hypothetical protein
METVDTREARDMEKQIDWQEVRGGHALWEHVVRIKDAHGNRRGCWTETAREISDMLGREVTQYQCQYVYYQYKPRPEDGERPGTANDANEANGVAEGVTVEETVESDPFDDASPAAADGASPPCPPLPASDAADDAASAKEGEHGVTATAEGATAPAVPNPYGTTRGLSVGGEPLRYEPNPYGTTRGLSVGGDGAQLSVGGEPLRYEPMLDLRPRSICRCGLDLDLPGLSVRISAPGRDALLERIELIEQWLGECRRIAEVAE